mgnify:FL=1
MTYSEDTAYCENTPEQNRRKAVSKAVNQMWDLPWTELKETHQDLTEAVPPSAEMARQIDRSIEAAERVAAEKHDRDL